jgi:urease subunit gamma
VCSVDGTGPAGNGWRERYASDGFLAMRHGEGFNRAETKWAFRRPVLWAASCSVGTVRLSPHEVDKLLLSVAAMVARDRLARGVVLNYPEAVAILSSFVLEGARDGRAVGELMATGRQVLRRDQLMEGVPEMLTMVQVEATFPDGTKLVTLHQPVP